jgi:hypothetical protein
MKRQFAVHGMSSILCLSSSVPVLKTSILSDYKRTQVALSTCPFCFAQDDSPPRAPLVVMGTQVYLSCTLTEELVKGHCLIVPMQHHLGMLEADDSVWDEVRVGECVFAMTSEFHFGHRTS